MDRPKPGRERRKVGLATLPRNNHITTETPMINQQTLFWKKGFPREGVLRVAEISFYGLSIRYEPT